MGPLYLTGFRDMVKGEDDEKIQRARDTIIQIERSTRNRRVDGDFVKFADEAARKNVNVKASGHDSLIVRPEPVSGARKAAHVAKVEPSGGGGRNGGGGDGSGGGGGLEIGT